VLVIHDRNSNISSQGVEDNSGKLEIATVDDGQSTTHKIDTPMQPAILITKSLPLTAFMEFRKMTMG
jgi:hypothetical protein